MTTGFLKKLKIFYLFLLFFVLPTIDLLAKPPYQVIAYFSTTGTNNSRGYQLLPANIPWNDITRIYEAFASISGTSINFTPSAVYNNLVTTAHSNSVRVSLMVGGSTQASNFVSATTAGNIAAFETNIMSVVNTYGFDGVDIDWEFPNPGNAATTQTTQFTNLIHDLSVDLRAQTAYDGLPKGVDFYGSPGYDICGFNWPVIGQYADYAILSGYAYQENIGSYIYDGPVSVPAGDNLWNCANVPHPFSIAGEVAELSTAPYNFPVTQMILGCPLYTGDGNTDTYTATQSWTYTTYSTLEMEAIYNGEYSVDTAQAYCDKISWAVGAKGMPGIALWEMSQACPYTSANVSGIWNAIGDTSGCITLPTATNTATNTATFTVTATATNTSTATTTATPTMTVTATFSNTPNGPTNTFTSTTTSTATSTITNTSIPTNTPTITNTPSSTSTATATNTPTLTKTVTGTSTFTPTTTPTITNTPSAGNPVVYPNPVTGTTVSVQIPLKRISNVTVKIFTVTFREVAIQTQSQVQVGVDISVPLIDKSGVLLANGLYYFVIEANGQRWVDKVLVLR